MPKPTPLTAAQIAAIASGASLPGGNPQASAEETPPALTAEQIAAAAALVAAGTQTPEQIEAARIAAESATAAAALAAATPKSLPADAAMISLLNTQLATANANLMATTIEKDRLAASAGEVSTTMPALLEIARDSIGKMQVALGGTNSVSASLSAAEVIKAHATASGSFAKRFVVGGAASTGAASTNDPEPKQAAVILPFAKAALAASK